MCVVIKAESLGKKYIISHESKESYLTLRDKIASSVKSIGKSFSPKKTLKQTKEEFWALKDINFEISQGDRVGIIGRNGAGKSTLLKILSRITEPSEGTVKLKGRVASLLEVGTGFHPELTGRENIFFNGSLLGMTRAEIKKKFDEIVEFSGVEKFIDTPVKRYSSGMYVRLAFAVAAHLESEILIVDEVLAVGDAEFQKKCLGKMEAVSKQGRTVLFVSHNIGIVKKLCNKGIYLEKGNIKCEDTITRVINDYLSTSKHGNIHEASFEIKKHNPFIKNIKVQSNLNGATNIDIRNAFKFIINLVLDKNIQGLVFSLSLWTITGIKVIYSQKNIFEKGNYQIEVEVPEMFLAPNIYYVNAALHIPNIQMFDFKEKVLQFEVIESGSGFEFYYGKDNGLIITNLHWNINKYNF